MRYYASLWWKRRRSAEESSSSSSSSSQGTAPYLKMLWRRDSEASGLLWEDLRHASWPICFLKERKKKTKKMLGLVLEEAMEGKKSIPPPPPPAKSEFCRVFSLPKLQGDIPDAVAAEWENPRCASETWIQGKQLRSQPSVAIVLEPARRIWGIPNSSPRHKNA